MGILRWRKSLSPTTAPTQSPASQALAEAETLEHQLRAIAADLGVFAASLALEADEGGAGRDE